jgi:hypothetical protein
LPKTTSDGQINEPLTGGFFWFPAPEGDRVGWSVLTCHDLGFDEDRSHLEIWPTVIERLACAWGREAEHLRKLLAPFCYGLPRGRITQPEGCFLLIHGDDAPIADWRARVLARFHLDPRSVHFHDTEHERTSTQDRTTVFAEFGLPELSVRCRIGGPQ